MWHAGIVCFDDQRAQTLLPTSNGWEDKPSILIRPWLVASLSVKQRIQKVAHVYFYKVALLYGPLTELFFNGLDKHGDTH